jgi:hypothetical protein
MEAEMLVVIGVTTVFFAFCVWLQLQSRREARKSTHQGDEPVNLKPERDDPNPGNGPRSTLL